jgi:hypothetical protein
MRHRPISLQWSITGLALGLALAAAPQAWGLAAQYTLTDLGLAGSTPTIAKDDNRVVGTDNVNGDQVGAQLSPTHLNLQDAWGVKAFPIATGAGRIVGVEDPSFHGLTAHAFVYTVQTDTVRDLGQTLDSPNLGSTATAVTQDDVGGYAENPERTRSLPILWIGGTTPVYLDTLGGEGGYVDAINDKGDALGASQTAADDTHCTFWPAAGGIVDCHPPNWDADSYGTDLNMQGLFVGYVTRPDVTRAFLGLPYGTVVLPPLPEDTHSLAHGINSLGDIVGESCRYPDPRGICRPTAWMNGAPVDLTTRITNAQGWELRQAFGVSDDGLIVGIGFLNGQAHSFLLKSRARDPSLERGEECPLLLKTATMYATI